MTGSVAVRARLGEHRAQTARWVGRWSGRQHQDGGCELREQNLHPWSTELYGERPLAHLAWVKAAP